MKEYLYSSKEDYVLDFIKEYRKYDTTLSLDDELEIIYQLKNFKEPLKTFDLNNGDKMTINLNNVDDSFIQVYSRKFNDEYEENTMVIVLESYKTKLRQINWFAIIMYMILIAAIIAYIKVVVIGI